MCPYHEPCLPIIVLTLRHPCLIRPSSRHDVSCVGWGLTVHVTTALSREELGHLLLYHLNTDMALCRF